MIVSCFIISREEKTRNFSQVRHPLFSSKNPNTTINEHDEEKVPEFA